MSIAGSRDTALTILPNGPREGVVVSLAEHNQVHASRRNGRALQISKAELKIFQPVFPGLLLPESNHSFRIIHRDHFFRPMRQ